MWGGYYNTHLRMRIPVPVPEQVKYADTHNVRVQLTSLNPYLKEIKWVTETTLICKGQIHVHWYDLLVMFGFWAMILESIDDCNIWFNLGSNPSTIVFSDEGDMKRHGFKRRKDRKFSDYGMRNKRKFRK